MDTMLTEEDLQRLNTLVSEKCETISDSELKEYYNPVIKIICIFIVGIFIYAAKTSLYTHPWIATGIQFSPVLIFSGYVLFKPWRKHAMRKYKDKIFVELIEKIKEEKKAVAIKEKKTLVKCKACGAAVSKMATTCLKCGENSPGLWIHCPQCQSLSVGTVKKGFGTKRAAAGYIVAGPIGFLLGQSGKEDFKLVCKECNHRWEFIKSDIKIPRIAKVQKKRLTLDNVRKKCPLCAEKIKLEAKKCRYCGETFEPLDVSKAIKRFKLSQQ